MSCELIEISGREDLLQTVWGWHRRSPVFALTHAAGTDDVTGPEWAHYCWLIDGVPQIGISLEERRTDGYEIYVSAASGVRPALVRCLIECFAHGLAQNPNVRVVAWIAATHRAALRLARRYMTEETRLLSEHSGLQFVRFGISGAEWRERWLKTAA